MTQLPSGLYGRLNFFICPCTIVRPIDSRRAPGVWPFAAFVSYCTRTILASRWLIPMPAGINHACMRAPVPSPLHFGCFQLPAQNCTYSAGSIKIVRTYSTPVTVLYSAWRDGCTLASVHAWWEYLLFQPEKSFREQGVQEIRDCRFLVRRRHDDGIKTYS